MYYVTCDGYPLLDWRDNDLILVNPKVKLEVNTVGEGSFTIYKNHPYYNKLKKLKSVFEVSDENSVIFRGRATGDTIDFDHGMAVDLEGAMAFFNDSVVRPYSFPKDFTENAEYNTAAASGNVIAFFLKWLIDNHNSQVQDFQKMKLGNVTVTDPNNYITRSNSNYSSTWETLKAKLFDSSLGGYLCIRYEADGNYIDYLSDFTETNSQRIGYGENLLDLINESEASETYSAIIPIGAAGLTIKGLDDGDITDDLVKEGDTIYSKSAVAEYGWIYAPTSETTWDDVTDDRNLRTKGAEWLANGGASVLKAIEATAVDLHFTTEQAESLRIYKNVEVYSAPHGISEIFPLSKLEIDLLNPQNTKVHVGKTLMGLTERTAIQDDEVLTLYSKITKTDEEIRIFVADELKGVENSINTSIDGIGLQVTNSKDSTSASIQLTNGTNEDGTPKLIGTAQNIEFNGLVTFTALSGAPGEGTTARINGGWVDADTLTVNAAKITGSLSSAQLNLYGDMAVYENAPGKDQTWEDIDVGGHIGCYEAPLRGVGVGVYKKDDDGNITGMLLCNETYAELSHAFGGSYIRVASNYIQHEAASYMQFLVNDTLLMELDADSEDVWALHTRGGSYGAQADLGNSRYPWGTVYADTDTIETSDRNRKNTIENLPDKYVAMFDMLVPRRFKLNNGRSGRFHVGYIAQEVEEAMAAVGVESQEFGGFVKAEGEDGEPLYMLRYGEFGAIYAAKIKQLETRVAELEVKQNG